MSNPVLSSLVNGYPTQITRGTWRKFTEQLRYEQTSAAIEEVVGRFAARGSSDYQVKLCPADEVPVGLFQVQKTHLPIVSGVQSSKHAENDEFVDVAEVADLVLLRLAESQTIVKGDYLEVGALGISTKLASGIPVARAAFSATTTTAPGWVYAWLLINKAYIPVPAP